MDLKNHPGMWLNDAAASAFNAFEDKYGVVTVNSAGRHEWEQQDLINLWYSPNRPSWLYRPAEPARTSPHVRNGGEAVDIRHYDTYRDGLAEFGFDWYGPGDPVHFNHNGDRRWIGGSGTSERSGYADGSVELGIFQEKLIRMGHDLGESGADKVFGPKTEAATRWEQKMSGINGYPGGALVQDGVPGPKTNGYLDWWLVGRFAGQDEGGHTATVADIQSLANKRGLQKVARLNGYTGGLDNDFGPGSQEGLQNFLNANYGGSLAAWLRSRWGYTDADDLWGPNMAAAAARADTANWNELP